MMKIDVSHLGQMSGHVVGIVMKELVRRAIVEIRRQKQIFEVNPKIGYTGQMDDMFTSADSAAQKVYIRSLRECFPDWGIVAEEDALIVPCVDGSGFYFTVDPLDGTKAFVRRQSHGVGTMISLSREAQEGSDSEFVAAYVGDVNTQEIYGFRPGSTRVHRISEFSLNEVLTVGTKPLDDQYVLLRDPERVYSPLSQKLIKDGFDGQLVDGGSIGTWMARLWKAEVGAALIPPSMETPWDSNPVNAISQKLGFVYLVPSQDGRVWAEYTPKPIKKKIRRDHDILVVHENNWTGVEVV